MRGARKKEDDYVDRTKTEEKKEVAKEGVPVDLNNKGVYLLKLIGSY